MTRKELADWCLRSAAENEAKVEQYPGNEWNDSCLRCAAKLRTIAAYLDPPAEMRERQAKAMYDDYMDGLIGCCEEPWEALSESYRDRLLRSLDAADEVKP